MLTILFQHLSSLITLTLTAWKDHKTHRFNALIPITNILLLIPFTKLGTGLITTNLFTLYLVKKKTLKPGDLLLTILYSQVYPSLQATFTLILATGLHLTLYPQIFEEKEWIPYAPAVLLAWILQLFLNVL
jgi:hypothetical protein